MDKVFYADRPIEHREHDALGMRTIAEVIARGIYAIPYEEGFTIAVVGRWGSGKTSILNMVAETLEDEAENTAILRFNPWLFGGASDLLTRFFGELSAQLGQGQSEKLKSVAKALSQFGKSLAPLSPVPGAALLLDLVDEQISSWAEPGSLFEERERLRKALQESDSRVVILLDDIDRLESDETRELVRLVRLTSDLPNVVFLLAFDRQVVEMSLSKAGIDGRQYLDKIVQMRHDVPVMRNTALRKILLEGLDELIKGRELLPIDQNVWPGIFYEIVDPLVENLRDVKRYLNSLSVMLDTVGQEVALVDLLGLEALKILRPSLFNELIAQREYLLGSGFEPRLWLSDEERKRHHQERLESLLEDAGQDRGVLDSALKILFPTTQEFLGGSSYAPSFHALWRKERRVACEEVLHIYLRAGLDEDTIPSRDIQGLMDALVDEKKLAQLLDALNEQHLEMALERLLDYAQEFPEEGVTKAVPVLANRIERLSAKVTGPFGIPPRYNAYRVIHELLKSVTDPAALAAHLPEMLGNVNALSGRQYIVERVGYREGIGDRLVHHREALRLEQQLLQQLTDATTEDLIGEWNIYLLLSRTRHWIDDADGDEFAARLSEHLTKDEFVLNVLRDAVGQRFINNGYQEYSEKILPWEDLMEIFGNGIVNSVTRLAQSQVYQALADDDRDTIDLAEKYGRGQ